MPVVSSRYNSTAMSATLQLRAIIYDWLLHPLITALLLKDRNTATALALKVTISLDNKPKSPSPILWLDIRRVRGLRLSDPFTAPREMSWTTRATY